MQESIELPSDDEVYRNNSFLSPESIKKDPPEQSKESRGNSHESLAYSNSTLNKERYYYGQTQKNTERSPLAFDFIKSCTNSEVKELIKNAKEIPIFEDEGQQKQSILKETSIRKKSNQSSKKQASKNLLVKKDHNEKKKQSKRSIDKDKKSISPKIFANKSKHEENIYKISHTLQNDSPNSNKNSVSPKQQRKTLEKHSCSDIVKLRRRNQQLQYTLQVQTVISEQLRTKVSVLSNLLEAKWKDNTNGMGSILKLKNSSQELKNIDIYVEMKIMQKNINEKDVINQRYKTQIKALKAEIHTLRQKNLFNQKNYINKQTSPTKQNTHELEALRQEKMSLFAYIQQQKIVFQNKNHQIIILQEENNLLIEKQNQFKNVERPRLFSQINERNNHIGMLEEDIEKMRMQFRFIQIKLLDQIQKYKSHVEVEFLERSRKSNKGNNVKDYQLQVDDELIEKLRKQLHILKEERDYYIKQNKQKQQEAIQYYALKLKYQAEATLHQTRGEATQFQNI